MQSCEADIDLVLILRQLKAVREDERRSESHLHAEYYLPLRHVAPSLEALEALEVEQGSVRHQGSGIKRLWIGDPVGILPKFLHDKT